jgi:hypothetical protein
MWLPRANIHLCSNARRGVLGSFLLVLFGAIFAIANAQTQGMLPDELKPSLNARLSQFIQAQADGEWDVVASMLGRYRGGWVGHHPFTQESKACLVSQMKAFPMIAFDMKDYRFSSEILRLPLDKRAWNLIGEAVFKSGAEEQKTKSGLTAYRDNGEWFFTPPDYDRYWEKQQFNDADLAIDRAEEIEIQDTPGSPLEITDVHAFLDKEELSLLNVTYKLRNRTAKKVTGFIVSFYEKGGSADESAPAAIDPGASIEKKQSLSRYVYFCDGVTKQKFIVVSVDFADGSQWNRSAHH